MTQLELIEKLHLLEQQFLKIEQMLRLNEINLTEKEKNLMIHPEVAALLAQFDTATNDIAARIQRLISSGGLNAEDSAALQAEVDKLVALGKDVPPPPL